MTGNDQMKPTDARNSFAGKTLTNSQIDEADAFVDVIKRNIRKSGKFDAKLKSCARAFAISEKFTEEKGEIILRDIFSARHGKTMNKMRLGLMENEATLPLEAKTRAMEHARGVLSMIKDGETMPFYQAYDHQAVHLATAFDITESGAKKLMTDIHREVEGCELYDVGKELQQQYHDPKRDAARQAREAQREQKQERTFSRQP